MSFADPIGDMITRIRNAQLRALNNVTIPGSKFRARVLDVLKREGYISNYKPLSDQKNKESLLVDLKYNNGLPVIKEIKRVSRPGRRIYAKADSIARIQNGPKGSKELTINDKIFTATLDDKSLILKLIDKNEKSKMMWGTTRSIINSALIGVSRGYEKILELSGVGFRANLKENILNLQIGFSHNVSYTIPEGIKLTVEKNTIIKISGIDKELVGKVSSEIKMIKPVEPYKGKGIKERGQYKLRKEGKKK